MVISDETKRFLLDPKEDLSDKIHLVTSDKTLQYLIGYSSFNGSVIPFIGPKWLDVDFDKSYCHLHYIPASHPVNKTGRNLFGFCEDATFHYYPEVMIAGEDWALLKNKLNSVLVNVSNYTTYSLPIVTAQFKEIDALIQSLGEKNVRS